MVPLAPLNCPVPPAKTPIPVKVKVASGCTYNAPDVYLAKSWSPVFSSMRTPWLCSKGYSRDVSRGRVSVHAADRHVGLGHRWWVWIGDFQLSAGVELSCFSICLLPMIHGTSLIERLEALFERFPRVMGQLTFLSYFRGRCMVLRALEPGPEALCPIVFRHGWGWG
jgi:hypothetical protein